MCHMFHDCTALEYLNISKFNIEKAYDIRYMLTGCSSLISLDLSNFKNTRGNISFMFQGCSSLKYLDISNLNTSLINDMGYLFHNCKSLLSLNLSNFNTSNVNNMINMFNGCSNLTSLDISIFDISSITDLDKLENIFSNCEKLEFINLNNYDGNNMVLFKKAIFQSLPSNFIILTYNEILINDLEDNKCFNIIQNDINIDNINLTLYKNKISEEKICTEDCFSTIYKYEYESRCYSHCLNGTFNNSYICEKCHTDCRECSKGEDNYSTNCLSCSNISQYLYLGNCLSFCSRGSYYNDINGQKMCKCELEQCEICSKESFDKNLCIKC